MRFVEYVLLMFWLVAVVSCQHEEGYQYPGNGIPIFSRNVEVKQLTYDLEKYAQSFPTAKVREGRLTFHDLNDFQFAPEAMIRGKEFSLQVEVKIEHGSCRIGIGDLDCRLGERGIIVKNQNTTFYCDDDSQVQKIVYDKFSTSSSVRFYSESKLLGIIDCPIDTPGKIRIELQNGCSGYLGPWIWLRGYE